MTKNHQTVSTSQLPDAEDLLKILAQKSSPYYMKTPL